MTAPTDRIVPTQTAMDPTRTMASLFVRALQSFRDAMPGDDWEVGDLVLLNYVSTAPNWREGLVDFLFNVTGDDPERVLDRALRAGRLRADNEGHLHATETVGELMAVLGPAAQSFNQSWRRELSREFSPQALDSFLEMLQHASHSETTDNAIPR